MTVGYDPGSLYPEIWEGLRNGAESGRLAHAYVVEASPSGEGARFVETLLRLIFCEKSERPCLDCPACRKIGAHAHVDVLWIEPGGKSRQISVEAIDDRLIPFVTKTSFEGGWKAVVLLAADRMNERAANKLLKTLEEPPAKTILLLVTEAPQSLLSTIVSRCQRLVLTGAGMAGAREETWRAELMDLLRELPPAEGLEAARLAGRMKGMMEEVKAGIRDAVEEDLASGNDAVDATKLKEIVEARVVGRLKAVQAEVFRVMLDWERDVLVLASGVEADLLLFPEEEPTLRRQAERGSVGQLLRNVGAIEEMAARLDRNIAPGHIFDEGFRKLVPSA